MRTHKRPTPHIPVFHAVPARARRDGWAPLKQAEFIGWLAQTRSVSAAAAEVGMAREGAYRLRAREWAAGFCAAWDATIDGPLPDRGSMVPRPKVTIEELEWRVKSGRWSVITRGGIYCGVRRKPDNSALLQLVARLGRVQV